VWRFEDQASTSTTRKTSIEGKEKCRFEGSKTRDFEAQIEI
jgi:hypothetical protein